ncbi:MAG: creatininase family protein [Candidatus Methanofastidiosia archaeon]
MNLQNLTWSDSKRYLRNGTVLIPTGSVEQHGLHNQVGCDYMIAERLCNDVASKKDVLVCPPLPYGVSKHHRHFFGTVWIEASTFKNFVLDVCMSLASHGAERIVIVNGHGGNTPYILDVVGEMRQRGNACALFEWWKVPSGKFFEEIFGKEIVKIWGHACAVETSLNMYLHPDLVKLEEARDVNVEWSPKVHGGQINIDTIDFTETGNIGFPTHANPEAGKRIFDFVTKELLALIEWMEREKVEKGHK